jgi:hypothetical protein
MKNYIITIGILVFLISCGKSEKPMESEKVQDTISVSPNESEIKETETLIFSGLENREYSEELDLALLSKVAANLKVNYEDVKIEQTRSVSYNDKITFFVITYIDKNVKQPSEVKDDNLGGFLTRMYVFVNKSTGKIIDKEIDDNLCVFEHEGLEIDPTYIFKKLIQLNETTNAIALSTGFDSSSRISLWSEQKFTIITLVNNKIIKLLYEYPMRKTQGDSNGGGSFQMEVLETAISVSNKKTNGFFDLKVAKTFSYEEEVEEDLEKGIKGKVEPVKIIKEVERIQYNGNIYSFKADDKYRFLLDYN